MNQLQPPQTELEKEKMNPVCSRCIIDGTVPGVRFDEWEICNFCRVHDTLEKQFPLGGAGQKKLNRIIEDVKRQGKNKKYDCIVGISGGRDSTFHLYLMKKVFGLRPLAVHFNDGFGNPVAGENMARATEKLGSTCAPSPLIGENPKI